jgi:L-serine dehydratase
MLSIFDIFYIGIGPSSSHTIGPMRAANKFITDLMANHLLNKVKVVSVNLYGSLAYTGEGHGTDRAITIGLEGYTPETVDPDQLFARFAAIESTGKLLLGGKVEVDFHPQRSIVHVNEQLAYHSNGMQFLALDEANNVLSQKTLYSVGGGCVVASKEEREQIIGSEVVPYPFATAARLQELCTQHNCKIYELMLENEKTRYPEAEVKAKVLQLADIMQKSILRGYATEGILPGGLNLRRRAPHYFKKAQNYQSTATTSTNYFANSAKVMCHLNAAAFAVAEENAAGGRVVVAPTCGSSGVLPAVLSYYKNFYHDVTNEKIVEFLLTAAAIEWLYKQQASISGAEVGCQGEIGVACSMAAAALTAVLGGSIQQVEKAAEIGIEHNLGLTCDPVRCLVQIPCIERNAVAANKVISIAYMALSEPEACIVSLDKAIRTMKQTGIDMKMNYKETSLGGLAVNFDG